MTITGTANTLFPPCVHSVFVISHDGFSEGWSAPIQAFLSLEDAKAAYALMSQTEAFGIFEVPIWPHIAPTGQMHRAWYSIEPIWPEKKVRS